MIRKSSHYNFYVQKINSIRIKRQNQKQLKSQGSLQFILVEELCGIMPCIVLILNIISKNQAIFIVLVIKFCNSPAFEAIPSIGIKKNNNNH